MIDTAKIMRGAIIKEHIKSGEITIRSCACQIETKTGLAADSTGVKASSPKFKINSSLKTKLILRASISAIPSDATVRVEVYDVTKDTVLGYVEFAGATGENETEITTGYDNGDLIQIRVNVTTASATSGATFDLDYAILEIEHYW